MATLSSPRSEALIAQSPVSLTVKLERPSPQRRLESLCDPGSVQPLEPAAADPGARVGVQAAWGRVAGRPIVCYAQDSSIAAGSVGVPEAEVIVRALRHSRDARVPLIGFLESSGARLQEGAAALAGFGRIFFENVALSGRSPQISVITGISAGGACYSPALTDFVVMTDKASMFLTGPRIVKRALGEDVSASDLGGAHVHARNGVCDFYAADDHSGVRLLRDLLGYLPQNGDTAAPALEPHAPADGEPDEVLPPTSRQHYDVRDLIARLVDGGRFLEVSDRWARNMVVGFARLEGQTVAIVANQARYRGGIIDVDASQKGTKFIRTCDALGVPLFVVADTPGFMPGSREEAAGMIGHGAELLRAFAAATLPAGDSDRPQGVRRGVHHDELQGSRRRRLVLLAERRDRDHERRGRRGNHARAPAQRPRERGTARATGPSLREGQPVGPGGRRLRSGGRRDRAGGDAVAGCAGFAFGRCGEPQGTVVTRERSGSHSRRRSGAEVDDTRRRSRRRSLHSRHGRHAGIRATE